MLDERDALFVDLRHKHFAAASLKISGLLDEFRARNAKVAGGKGGRMGDLELRNMSKLIQSLPQYRWALAGVRERQVTAASGRLPHHFVQPASQPRCHASRPRCHASRSLQGPAVQAGGARGGGQQAQHRHRRRVSGGPGQAGAGPRVWRRHEQGGHCLPHRTPEHSCCRQGVRARDTPCWHATFMRTPWLWASPTTVARCAQVRLLMCYSATHQEKLDPTREAQWQKVARLTQEDMAMVTNLEYLGVPGEQAGGVAWQRHAARLLLTGAAHLRCAANSTACTRSTQAQQGRRHQLWAQAAARRAQGP